MIFSRMLPERQGWHYMAWLSVVMIVSACVAPLSIEASCLNALAVDFGDGLGNFGLTGDSQRLSNLIWNPASLGLGGRGGGYVTYSDYLANVKTVGLGYRAGTGQVGVGIHGSYLGSHSMKRTTGDDPAGGLEETFSYGESQIGLGIGRGLFRRVGVGGTLRWASYGLEDLHGEGLFVDIGTILQVLIFDGLRPRDPGFVAQGEPWELNFSIVCRSLSLRSWGDFAGDAPSYAEFSLTAVKPARLSAGFGLLFMGEGRREIRGGLCAKPTNDFETSFGYRRRTGRFSDTSQGFPWHRGLTGGFAVRIGQYWLGYHFEDSAPLDGIHRFCLELRQEPSH